MESISTLEGIRRLKEAGLSFVDMAEVGKLLGITKVNTIYKLLQRWEKYGVVERVAKGLYKVASVDVGEYEIANRLVEPSYVSLETALNHYGILSQFPYVTTSVTTSKTRQVVSMGREYEYAKIDPGLYWGYEKSQVGLMAVPEKAIVDQLYMKSKGLRSAHVDEWDMSTINRSKLKDYCERVQFGPFRNLIKERKLI